MKNIIAFFLAVILIACTTENSEFEKNEFIEVSSKNGNGQIDVLHTGLYMTSYLVGRVLLRHTGARRQAVNNRNNMVIGLTNLLDVNNPDQTFRIAFDYEIRDYYSELGEPQAVGPPGSGGGIIPKIDTMDEFIFSSFPSSPSCSFVSSSLLIEFIDENCLELFVPITLNLKLIGSTVHITPHPLNEGVLSAGYKLWQNPFLVNPGKNEGEPYAFDGSNVVIEPFSNLPSNFVVVRPIRNTNCLYNYVPVVDFTTFFEID
jgi:hypothetical protein